MRKIDKRKKEARAAAAMLGHDLAHFTGRAAVNDKKWTYALCKKCGAWVDIMDNSFVISGTALNVKCKGVIT